MIVRSIRSSIRSLLKFENQRFNGKWQRFRESSLPKVVPFYEGVLLVVVYMYFPIISFIPMSVQVREECAVSVPITTERHHGKVQFLRLEHGYIRTKVKINGIRDVTFYYSDLSEGMKETLALGTTVTFTVDMDSNGKFCAKNIEIDEVQSEHTTPKLHPIPSTISISSLDITSDDDSIESAIPSRKSSFSLSVRTPATMQQYLQQYIKPAESKSSIVDAESLSRNVDHFLELALSKNFNSNYCSCWLF